ncbi:histidine kinase [Psychromicrobium lacuslunae]|uniref:Histidine kinase n=1 Tax=Psychromicrobium lacuslunae TaxID=1618207 RepID=A0A0D4BW39_9MICC|nr:histidine kinase [Psychromicrobium lacuslunae]AJT40518.1 histidine kinase [Psychromicrobium lacuslunae]
MPEPTFAVIALLIGLAILATLLALLGFRLSRSHRELGSDADRASYTTLHLAARAGEQLRAGLQPGSAAKAAKQLRALLGCDALAISDTEQMLAWDGTPLALERGFSESFALAQKTLQSGRSQVFRFPYRGSDAAVQALDERLTKMGLRAAVVVPIRLDQRVIGTLSALSSSSSSTKSAPSAGLVRAANEVADWVAGQLQLAELSASKTLLMEAEVRALRAQISPHFIYNSLNAIASYVITDPERARELLVEFADFTRYSFRRHGDFTTVAEELRSIDRYLLLERARFGDRLQVSLQIGPEVLSTLIPFLSLQPLVENAVQHGIEAKAGVGHIKITAQDSGAYAQITIEDDGVGMDPAQLAAVLAGQAEGDHIGLRNVDARLRQVYGEDHGLVVDTGPDAGTLITLRIPKFQPEHSLD